MAFSKLMTYSICTLILSFAPSVLTFLNLQYSLFLEFCINVMPFVKFFLSLIPLEMWNLEAFFCLIPFQNFFL